LSGPRQDARTWGRRGNSAVGERQFRRGRTNGGDVVGRPRGNPGTAELQIHERESRPRTSRRPVPEGSSHGEHRFFCDRDSEAPVGSSRRLAGDGQARRGSRRSAREEDTRKRVHRGGGESLGEETRAPLALPGRKAWDERWRSVGTPRALDGSCPSRRAARCAGLEPKGRPAWIWVKQAVERVRNPEDGECRKVAFFRVIRAPRSGNAL